jgi:hypothetical protein
MSAQKFEKLIELLINENKEAADQLFHEIVIEKSRSIYESIMDEDMTSGLIDEISSEEEGMEGMMEDDDEFTDDEEIAGDYDVDSEEMEFDGEEDMDGGDEEIDVEMDADEFDDEEGDAELEDRVVDLEDKLDELMAEFESLMADDGGEEIDVDVEGDDDEVMEAVEMKKVSVTHTDGADSSAKKSPVDANSGATGMASKPVNFAGGTDEKGRTAPATKPVTSTKFKNAPGGDGSKTESAPKPVTKQASGVNTKDIVPESKRTTKKRI